MPWYSQILAGQLTLSLQEGADYAHQITTGTPGFLDLPTALKRPVFSTLIFTRFFFLDSREDAEEDGTLEGRKTVTSTIKFRPTSRDDSATYACEAVHPALQQNERVSVVLSVMCK